MKDIILPIELWRGIRLRAHHGAEGSNGIPIAMEIPGRIRLPQAGHDSGSEELANLMDKLSVPASLRRDLAHARHAAEHFLDTFKSAGPRRIGNAAEWIFVVVQESTGRFGARGPPIQGASVSAKPNLRPH